MARPETFLTSREEWRPLFPLGPPGEKSLGRAVALKAIEAKPACGEIRPSEPRWAMGQELGRFSMAIERWSPYCGATLGSRDLSSTQASHWRAAKRRRLSMSRPRRLWQPNENGKRKLKVILDP